MGRIEKKPKNILESFKYFLGHLKVKLGNLTTSNQILILTVSQKPLKDFFGSKNKKHCCYKS